MAETVLEAAARRLADAIADYDAALDRGAFMPELQHLDREVARAEHVRTVVEQDTPPSPPSRHAT